MMRAVILLVGLFAAAQGDYNDLLSVCEDNALQNADPQGLKSLPAFSNEMEVLIEQTQINEKQVIDMHLDYSESAGKLHMVVKGSTMNSEMWVDANRDLYMNIDRTSDAQNQCKYQNLDVNVNAQFLGFFTNVSGHVVLGTPQDVLHFKTVYSSNFTYVGNGSVRGIPTEMWQVCQSTNEPASTSSVIFHFSDSSVTSTPSIQQPLLAAIVNTSWLSYPNFRQKRYDYVNMHYLSGLDSNHVVPPAETYCVGESNAKNLPALPYTFSFKTEVLTFADASDEDALPTMTYTRQEYIQSLAMYTRISLSQPDTNGYADYKLTVHDFNMMLSYSVDMISGSCLTTQITKNSVDDITGAGGKITMKSPQEFFHLTNNYQYIGVRKHLARGIDCDVWVSFSTDQSTGQSVMYVWYFASAEWKMSFLFDPTQAIPVSLEEYSGQAKKIYNIFEYSTQAFSIRPDYSQCFSNDKITVVMGLSGGSYQQIYLGYASEFTTSLVLALIENGLFTSPSRVVNIDVQPGQGNNMIVRFTILGNPEHIDNLAGGQYLNSSQIYQNLLGNLQDNGISFTITDEGGAIHGKMTVTSIRSISRRYPTGRPGPMNRPRRGNQGTSGFSSGDMAGIALGLLIAGVIIGFAAVFLIHRYRKSRNIDIMSVKMQNIQED